MADNGRAGDVRILLQPARAQCLRLSERFFIYYATCAADHVSVLAIAAGWSVIQSYYVLVCLCTSSCTYACCLRLISVVVFYLYHAVACFFAANRMYITGSALVNEMSETDDHHRIYNFTRSLPNFTNWRLINVLY